MTAGHPIAEPNGPRARPGTKTTITLSINESLLDRADDAALNLGISRSAFMSRAAAHECGRTDAAPLHRTDTQR